MLEVVGVTGVVHLGQIQSGFRSALRIAQVRAAHSVILKQTTVLFGICTCGTIYFYRVAI